MNKDARILCKIIEADGWVRVSGRGHLQYIHPTKKGRVTVPSVNIKKNIIKSVLRQAGLKGSLTDFKNGHISQNLPPRSDDKH